MSFGWVLFCLLGGYYSSMGEYYVVAMGGYYRSSFAVGNMLKLYHGHYFLL